LKSLDKEFVGVPAISKKTNEISLPFANCQRFLVLYANLCSFPREESGQENQIKIATQING